MFRREGTVMYTMRMAIKRKKYVSVGLFKGHSLHRGQKRRRGNPKLLVLHQDRCREASLRCSNQPVQVAAHASGLQSLYTAAYTRGKNGIKDTGGR